MDDASPKWPDAWGKFQWFVSEFFRKLIYDLESYVFEILLILLCHIFELIKEFRRYWNLVLIQILCLHLGYLFAILLLDLVISFHSSHQFHWVHKFADIFSTSDYKGLVLRSIWDPCDVCSRHILVFANNLLLLFWFVH